MSDSSASASSSVHEQMDLPRDFLPVSSDIFLSSAVDWSTWSSTITNILVGRDLEDHLDPVLAPSSTAPTYAHWRKRDKRVRSYIIASLEASLRADLMDFVTTADVWTALRSRYVEASGSREHHLLRQAWAERQGDRSIQQFLSVMRGYWRELQAMAFSPSAADITAYQRYQDRQQLHQFLMSLRPEMQTVAGLLLHRDPLPGLDTAITELISEETRLRSLATTTAAPPSSVYAGTLAVTPPVPSRSAVDTRGLLPRPAVDTRVCSHCQRPGHLIAECWLLHPERRPTLDVARGRGQGMRGRGRRFGSQTTTRPAVTITTADTSPTTGDASTIQDRLQCLEMMMIQHPGSSTTSVSASASPAASHPSSSGSTYGQGDWRWP